MRILAATLVFSVGLFLSLGPVVAADLSKPTNTTNNVRQADPPKATNTQKPSPVGQPVTNYKPKGPSVHPKPVPPPATSGSNKKK